MKPNYDLILSTWSYVRLQPKDWKQSNWRCSTGMCFAGWAVELSGLKWLVSQRNLTHHFDCLWDAVVVPEELAPSLSDTTMTLREFLDYNIGSDDAPKMKNKNRLIATAEDVATELLGISNPKNHDIERDYLFNGDNNVKQIQYALTEILGIDPDELLDKRVNRTVNVPYTLNELMAMNKVELTQEVKRQAALGLISRPERIPTSWKKIKFASILYHCEP